MIATVSALPFSRGRGPRRFWQPRVSTCILHSVRWLGLLAVVLLAPAANAAPRKAATNDGDFWRDMVDPHSQQVKAIVDRARGIMTSVDGAIYGEIEAGRHARAYRDAYGMLAYAHKLSPENLEVLALLGDAADEAGKTHQAIDALTASIRLTGEAKASAQVTGRLGFIYLRLGKLDQAVRYLELAQTAVPSSRTLVHLATALAARGQMADALDVLSNNVQLALQYPTTDSTLLAFALAVQYDRDDQHHAAFEILDKLMTVLQGNGYGPMIENALAQMRFAPAEDRYYYHALFYESLGNYTEARAEWATYAAAGDLPWRGRALEHIAAIDRERRSPAVKPPPQAQPPVIRRPRSP
jgi:tetratricopeptide (TPR) repeat protein